MHSENWDDLRFVLAVADCGSVSGAARALGVNHATVLRRIAAFETRHRVSLFTKTARGYEISPDRLQIVEAARQAEAAIIGVSRLIRGERAPLEGTMRLTSTDTLCATILPDILAGIMGQVRGLRIDLIATNAYVDFGKLQADISVRPALTLPDDLVGEPAAEMAFAVYAPRGVRGARWLGLSGPLSRSVAATWMGHNVAAEEVVGTADSFMVLARLVAAGAGRAVLPCILGDTTPGIERAAAKIIASVPLWVASHADLADSGRLRSLRQSLVRALDGERDALAGISGG